MSRAMPPLDASHEAIAHVLHWAARAVADGDMTANDAGAIDKMCKTMISLLNSKHGQREMVELRDLVERMEAAQKAAEQREIAVRTHAPGH